MYHIHTCLTKRVELVLRDAPPDTVPAFHGIPFDMRAVVKSLKGLADTAKVNMSASQTYKIFC